MNGRDAFCTHCGRRLVNDAEDGIFIEDTICSECDDAQNDFYRDGLAV